ncbi:hypothetical protein [Paraburkholderia phenoliruptrix]|uniref:hypothetical protein n=1 Tax=Paraburkholderia phenoliruptrix TaxID=252970 RepID=UPI002869CE7E|nr:hypothetical protein [Paraburkholderia phenoliruptrix]WMY11107.1 hypothetical protein P3F88_31120 [Paraburkholderia phenoliruptrix]
MGQRVAEREYVGRGLLTGLAFIVILPPSGNAMWASGRLNANHCRNQRLLCQSPSGTTFCNRSVSNTLASTWRNEMPGRSLVACISPKLADPSGQLQLAVVGARSELD